MLPNEFRKILEQMEKIQQEMQHNGGTPFGRDLQGAYDFNFGSEEYISEIHEDEDSVKVIVDLPGYTEDDISIKFTGDMLLVEADATDGELQRRSMQKKFRIEQNAIVDETEARFENGVLTVEIPTEEEDNSGTEIRIS